VADVRPFQALTFDPAVAGPLAALVAPPYDVIDADARSEYLARSPHNIVNLTLPEDENDSGPLLSSWRDRGVLRRDSEPALWWLEQSFVGPDGVARTRAGFLASIKVEPYENKVVLPHERTHAGPKEGRLRLLTATRTQVEPIFLLYDDPDAASRLYASWQPRASPISTPRSWAFAAASGALTTRRRSSGCAPRSPTSSS